MSVKAQKVDVFAVVKDIPFPEVQQAFSGEEVKRGKMLCPFHDERTPSFQVYDDGFKCFGCLEFGDAIDFVAKLEGVSLIDAARMIAQRFGLAVDWPPNRQEVKKHDELKRKRDARKLYEILEREAYFNLLSYRDTVNYLVGLEWESGLSDSTVKKAHKLPLVEEYLRILAAGSNEEKLQLLRDGGMALWARLNSHKKMKK